jgi:hypothetical protein
MYRSSPNQRLDINTGAGADTVLMYGHNIYSDSPTFSNQGYIRIQTYQSEFENDVDSVTIRDNTAINLGILTGDGADTVSVTDSNIATSIAVYTHGGNDSLSLSNVRARDSVFASLGEGDDSLGLGAGGVTSNAFDAYGGNGFDTLGRPDTLNPGLRIKSGFEKEVLYRSLYYYGYVNNLDATFSVWS